MKKSIIIKYEIDNKLYMVYEYNKEYYAIKLENGQVSTVFSKEEEKQINYIFSKMSINKNKSDIGIYNYDNKNYRHFYDRDNDWHTFYEEKDGALVLPSIDVIKHFNNIFNNQEMIAYLKDEKKDNNFIKRIIKIGKKTIVVLLSASVLLEGAYAINNINNYVEPQDSIVSTEEIDETKTRTQDKLIEDFRASNQQIINDYQKVSILVEAIMNNGNLKQEEKELFLSNVYIFYDNIEYMDFDTVYKNLSTLSITYDPMKGDCAGCFYDSTDSSDAKIIIFESSSFKDANKSILLHEFCHALETNVRNWTMSGLFETVNVIFNNEYFGTINGFNHDDGYSEAVAYLYALLEIINPNTLKKFHSTHNINEVADELYDIIPNYEMADQLFTNISLIKDYKLNPNDPNNIQAFESLKRENFEIISRYYVAKYHKSMFENFEIMLHLDKNVLFDLLKEELLLGSLEKEVFSNYFNIVSFKGYFNTNSNKYMSPSTISYCSEANLKFYDVDIEQAKYNGDIKQKDDGTYDILNVLIFVDADGKLKQIGFISEKTSTFDFPQTETIDKRLL